MRRRARGRARGAGSFVKRCGARCRRVAPKAPGREGAEGARPRGCPRCSRRERGPGRGRRARGWKPDGPAAGPSVVLIYLRVPGAARDTGAAGPARSGLELGPGGGPRRVGSRGRGAQGLKGGGMGALPVPCPLGRRPPDPRPAGRLALHQPLRICQPDVTRLWRGEGRRRSDINQCIARSQTFSNAV